ncbi:hypothetical protein CHUAL_010716 [Chamberlinius hualienensis]
MKSSQRGNQMLIIFLSYLILSPTLISAIPLENEEKSLVPHSREKRFLPFVFPLLLLGAAKSAAGTALQVTLEQARKSRNVIVVKNWVGSNLDVQCKSGDDDLGRRTLKDQEGYAFSFKENIWGSTHFWCDVWWNGKHKYFPAYGEGAPKGSMNYDIYGYGFYRNGNKFQNW